MSKVRPDHGSKHLAQCRLIARQSKCHCIGNLLLGRFAKGSALARELGVLGRPAFETMNGIAGQPLVHGVFGSRIGQVDTQAMLRMPPGHGFDERGALPCPCARDRFARRLMDSERIIAVNRHARDVVCRRPRRNSLNR